jgi:hypothetical protein
MNSGKFRGIIGHTHTRDTLRLRARLVEQVDSGERNVPRVGAQDVGGRDAGSLR